MELRQCLCPVRPHIVVAEVEAQGVQGCGAPKPCEGKDTTIIQMVVGQIHMEELESGRLRELRQRRDTWGSDVIVFQVQLKHFKSRVAFQGGQRGYACISNAVVVEVQTESMQQSRFLQVGQQLKTGVEGVGNEGQIQWQDVTRLEVDRKGPWTKLWGCMLHRGVRNGC